MIRCFKQGNLQPRPPSAAQRRPGGAGARRDVRRSVRASVRCRRRCAGVAADRSAALKRGVRRRRNRRAARPRDARRGRVEVVVRLDLVHDGDVARLLSRDCLDQRHGAVGRRRACPRSNAMALRKRVRLDLVVEVAPRVLDAEDCKWGGLSEHGPCEGRRPTHSRVGSVIHEAPSLNLYW